ncbi:hypothetical protein [Neobacillus drentensis]|uniref:hypothetical protein n=1 Tax=Neobacillus drentensis TaxID=220684 RepID=UPI003000CE71
MLKVDTIIFLYKNRPVDTFRKIVRKRSYSLTNSFDRNINDGVIDLESSEDILKQARKDAPEILKHSENEAKLKGSIQKEQRNRKFYKNSTDE